MSAAPSLLSSSGINVSSRDSEAASDSLESQEQPEVSDSHGGDAGSNVVFFCVFSSAYVV